MRSLKFVFSAALAVSGSFAQAQVQGNPAEIHMPSAFIENLVNLQSTVCSQRDPGSKEAWARETQAWKARHQEALVGVRRSVEQIEARGVEFAPLIVAANSQAIVTPLMMLASADDAQAAQTCNQFRKNLTDEKLNDRLFAEAKAATAAVLARAGAPRQ